MKKIFILLLAVSTVLFTLNSCTEEDYTDKYLNPEKVTTTSVDKLFTGVLEKAGEFLRIGYGRFMLHDQGVGKLAQAWGVRLDDELYNDGLYMYSAWGWYIGVVTQYKVLKAEYEKAGDETLKAYELCGRAVMYQTMLQTLDEFGKLPYSEVGLYPATGEMVFAHLDDTKELYELIMDDLGAINSELPAAGEVAANTDWLNDGNMEKWRKYVNSLRLRAAIRVSGAEDYTNPENTLKTKGGDVIKEILGNPGQHPVVTGADDQILVTPHGTGNGWWSTITAYDNYAQWHSRNTASKARIDRLDLNGDGLYTPENDDPRLPLFYDPVQGGPKGGLYVGINTHDKAADIATNVSGVDGIKQYSFVNERSFRDNRKINSYVITASEIAFYKAEAILRFGVSGEARAEFIRGVYESVKMFAKINAESDAAGEAATRSPVVDMSYWTDARINEFAARLWDNGSNKLKLVYEQLWLHCAIFNSTETWNTLRRTGYPNDLYFPYTDAGNCRVLPQRFIVPVSEAQRNENMPNEDNYGAYTPGES
ncbi:MAG: SusD/RagB family nutrient-binding outer membrane lipoprotein, partial [Prevotellaceae bacterium]|nr:SusD/RagB family nutrient-binding outer membrane lipoprotein [Prevotellaceae bacterium]